MTISGAYLNSVVPWIADRKFILTDRHGENFDLDSNKYDNGEDFVNVPCVLSPICLKCGLHPRHIDQIVVAIDGACRGNGGPNAQAAIGVHFLILSQWNLSEVLTDSIPTSQRAELTACLRALETIPSVMSNTKVGTVVGIHGEGNDRLDIQMEQKSL